MALPNDLLADVLGRLPARSLAASRSVCKAWRDLVDERRLLLRLRRLLPLSVRGLFINYQDCKRPHFFARRAAPGVGGGGGPRIDGKFDFIARKEHGSWYEVMDHCNGLILYGDTDMDVLYVCNPTTRRWARLPPLRRRYSFRRRRAFLVFDPAASPAHYKVLLEHVVEPDEEDGDACRRRLMEWPPAAWAWQEFSSETGRWEEKVFGRDGEAAGTFGDLLLDSFDYYREKPRWRHYAAYWQGALYIHCSGEFVSRFSLDDGKYKVIKSPIDLAECTSDVRSFLGRSEKGVYFAAIDYIDKLRVWVLSESNGQTGWVSRHDSKLKTSSWWLHEKKCRRQLKYHAPWILEIPNKKRCQEPVPSVQQDACWNSDDDAWYDENVSDDEEKGYSTVYVRFLGFHPYKEVIFFCHEGSAAIAFSLNSSKVQYLGPIDLGRSTYNHGEREAFVYTPCLIGDY